MDFRRVIVTGFCIALLCMGTFPDASLAQDNVAVDKERVTADRFLQVLMRRPRPGTALDRVYGYHVQNGSLDELIASLDVAEDTEASGEKTMILGLIQSQRGKSSLAAEALAKAEERLPTDAACSFYLGKALLAIGETERAAAAMQRAIERGPARNEALPIFTELGRIYGRAGQNEKALAVWKQLEAMFPGDARVGGQIARTLAEEGNVDEALARFITLSKSSRDEDDKIAFAVEAAEMRRRLGQSDQATKDLEDILARLRPGSWLYSDVRGRIEDGFLKSGDYDALANYYQGQLAETKDNLALQTRLGRILVSAGRLDEAKQTLQAAVEKAPDDANVRLALVDVLIALGDIGAAAEQYEALAKNDSENPDYLLRWGQLLLEDQKVELADRRDAAAEVWQRLADARTDDAVTLSQIADRFRGIDRTDDAIALYRKAIEVDPTSPQYREYLGEYFHKLGRKDEAIATWQSMAEGDRRDRESLVRLAEVFGTFDLGPMALVAWKDAAKLDLTFAQELRYAKTLRDAKQHEQSLARLEVARKIAETPDEQEQVLRDQIATYADGGTLGDQIANLKAEPATSDGLRQLAMMHQAAGQLTDAAVAIAGAIELEPENIDVLIVAADIAERQTRFADAAEWFEKLAKVDARFRTNYLQRVADLQVRLGQIDDALATCESLIDANPASPESYLFYARTALTANRDDEAFTALRRAMNVAPRDNGPRRMMASELAERYRTDEAIELYWQAMQYETKTEDRVALVKQLGPLYDRQGDVDELISRIEAIGREDGDARGMLLLTSAAYEAIEDYGAARQAIDKLLAQQPRDVALLESMVNLSNLADEVVMAAEFQERIVALADTPENRFKMVQLKLDAGMIDIATALGERISLVSDPVRLGSMIASAAARGDSKTAIAICREALDRDASLWDVKLELAQLLFYDDGDDREKSFDEAAKLCEQIREAGLAMDAKPPTQKTAQKSASANSMFANYPPNYLTSPVYWTQSAYELARNYRLGRYGNANYGYSSGGGVGLVQPRSFGQARVIAASLLMIRETIGKNADEVESKVTEMMEGRFALPSVDQVDDPMAIWEYRSLQSFESMLLTKPAVVKPKEIASQEKDRQESISWRLAELDPENGAPLLTSMLTSRIDLPEAAKPKEEPKDDEAAEADEPIEPLSAERLELLVQLFNRNEAMANASSVGSSITQLNLRSVLMNEFTLVGLPERAAEYTIPDPEDDASFSELLATIAFHLRMGSSDRADELVDRLMPAARSAAGGKSSPQSNSINGSMGVLSQASAEGKAFLDEHRLALLDAVLAHKIGQSATSRSRSGALSEGTLQTYYQSPTGGYRSIQVKAPLSTSLIDQSMVTELSGLIPDDGSKKQNSRDQSIRVPAAMITHLQTPLPDAPVYELKSRGVLAAFAHWWDDRPTECYEALIKLCETYPDDVDLQIERARLASELNQPRVALDALDSFDPLDSRMLVRKEMAAMNLAAELGDIDRAKQSAQRLFGMRMDTNTQLALVDQLRRLGMNEKAAAVLRRMRGGKSRDESVELQIARSFLASEDKDSAAEVAYNLLRRFSSGRSKSQGNEDYYRRQAVEILTSAGRMEPLIERAERRLKSTPSSTRVRSDLAELYTAAGRTDDAEKLWENVDTDRPVDARTLIARAAAMVKAKKFKEAADLYLDAFEKEPNLMSNHYYEMRTAVQGAKCDDAMFERLLTFNVDSLPSYRLNELTSMGDRRNFSEAKIKFISHALKSSYGRQNFYSIVDNVPDSEAKKIPAIRDAMVGAICSDDAFAPVSTLWEVRSRSSGGTARGPLDGLVKMIAADKEVAAKFEEAASTAKENETTAPSAEFLLALVGVVTAEADGKDAAAERLGKAIPTVSPEDDEDEQTISGGLLWQAGQVIEKIAELPNRPAMVVAMYEAAHKDANVPRTDFEYSVAARLVDAYAANDQSDKARRFALDGYASIDHSSQNQYNPGYGDYQELTEYRSVADKLVQMGCPIDALAIYRRAMSEPARFEKAKRWGGSLSIETFVDAAKTASEKVNPETSTMYLRLFGDDLRGMNPNDRRKSPVIDLMDLSIDMLLSGEEESSLAMAIRSAQTTEEGKAELRRFATTLDERSRENDDDWSFAAAALLIAVITESDTIESKSESLSKAVPPIAEITAAAGNSSASKYAGLLDLFPIAKAATQSDIDASEAVAKTLIDYLRSVAKTIGEPRLDLALSKLTGESSASFATYLDSIEAIVKPGAPLSPDQCDTALNIARTSAIEGDIGTSTRALTLALGNGPPLRQMAASGDAFAISRSSSNNRNRDDGGMGELVRQVNELIDIYSDTIGVKLGQRKLKAKEDGVTNQRTGDSDESLPQIYEALATIVLPPDRPAVVFPYATEIASTTGYDRGRPGEVIQVESAALSLAVAAEQAGQAKSLIEQLETRLEKTTEKAVLASILVNAALVSGDVESLDRGLNAFNRSVDAALPPADAVTSSSAGPTSITSQMQQDSYRKSEIVNTVLGCIWPLIDGPLAEDLMKSGVLAVPPEIAERSGELLQRTAALIDSDGYTSNRHRNVASAIRNKMLTRAVQSGDRDRFRIVMNAEIQTREARYASMNPSDRLQYTQRELERLLDELIEDGLVGNISMLIRQLIEADLADGISPESIVPAKLCMAIAELPKSDQFDALMQITLGSEPDEPIRHWTGFVRYDTPPELVRRQTPRWKDVEALTTTAKQFPTVDTTVMLADVAAELDRSDEVAEVLTRHSKQVGDDADVAVALVRLAQAGGKPSKVLLDSIEETLAAVDADLVANKPAKDDKTLRYPMLATHLVARLIDAGVQSPRYETLLQSFKMFAVRGQRNLLTSGLGRIRASAGIGRAAGATEASPLRHFVPVPLPQRYSPDVASLRPLYRIDGEGWVSGTSGNENSLLMLRFPITGTFGFTADIFDGSWGEADVAYGGVLYQPTGWKGEARIIAMAGNTVRVKVPSIKANKLNEEGLQVTETSVLGMCNGEAYVTDVKTQSYPWLSVLHMMARTTKFNNIRLTGDPKIPPQVNLIDPTMRGWGILTSGRSIADPMLPIGYDQDAEEIAEQRRLADEQKKARWIVVDGELKYESAAGDNTYDPSCHIAYLRPLMDGDSVEYSFWWTPEQTEVHPTVGRTMLQFTKKGVKPSWINVGNDLATIDMITTDKLDPPAEYLASENMPKEDNWNKLKMRRDGETVRIELNDKPLVDVPVTDPPRPGLYRHTKRDVRVRDMILTGDWPSEVPADLMERAGSSEPKAP